jgi:hypothetical protein
LSLDRLSHSYIHSVTRVFLNATLASTISDLYEGFVLWATAFPARLDERFLWPVTHPMFLTEKVLHRAVHIIFLLCCGPPNATRDLTSHPGKQKAEVQLEISVSSSNDSVCNQRCLYRITGSEWSGFAQQDVLLRTVQSKLL